MHAVLISGAYGFVGKNISFGLSEESDFQLYALDINKDYNTAYVKHYTWNELDHIDWDKIDTIIHLAGIAHDTKNTLDEKKYFEINVGLTELIFNYFLKSKAKKFIFFSSVKAVADSVRGEVLTEDFQPDPHTPYGKSKLMAEQYILRQSIPAEKKIYILRPCMIHGPGNKGNLNLLYKFVKLGIPYPLGAFENKRSYTSIANLKYILQQIIEYDIASGIYQVADDEALSTNEVISLMALTLRKKVRIWRINKTLINRIAKFGELFHLPFNSERLKKLTDNYVVSNRKLLTALGKTLPVSSREGLLCTLKSFNNNF